MAQGILNGKFQAGTEVQQYWHEVESFIWVLIWLYLRQYPLSQYFEWRRGTSHSVSAAKSKILGEYETEIPNTTPPTYTRAW
ncbi:hypothetical protein BDQ17DRAFT_1476922, partial [Cyathus striatus]